MFGQKKIMIRSLTYLNIERDAQNFKFEKTIFFFRSPSSSRFCERELSSRNPRERALSASVTNVDSRANYLHNNSRSRSQQIKLRHVQALSPLSRMPMKNFKVRTPPCARIASEQRSVSIRNKFYRNYSIYQNAFFFIS